MDFKLPEIGEGVYEAELVNWLVNSGDAVKPGQNLMEVMTDKATMEIPSPFAGKIQALRAQPGQQVKVGEVVLSYQAPGQEKAKEARETAPIEGNPRDEVRPAPKESRSVPSAGNARPISAVPTRAAPSVRLMARKLGIDLAGIRGSGPDGRILVEDISRQVTLPGSEARRQPEEVRLDYGRPGQRVKLQGIRRAVADHMVRSKATIPHYTYVDECDVTELVHLREAYRELGDRAGVKLTYLPFFVKAVVGALMEVPVVNASLDEGSGEIVLHDHYHIGIAVATASGLMVPVVHDADKKDLLELAREVDRLTSVARNGKVKREELQGGTFTITSIGSIGGLFATPIIPTPQAAILGIGKIVKRPVFDAAGQVKPADVVYLSLSFDHRILDGAVGAAFGNAIIKRLQKPLAMVVDRE